MLVAVNKFVSNMVLFVLLFLWPILIAGMVAKLISARSKWHAL